MCNKYLISITFLFVFSVNVLGQINNQDSKQRLQSQKVAFITKQLNLSVKEAQSFWPVYNELMNKKEELLNKKKALMIKIRQSTKISNTELEKLADENIEFHIKEAELTKIYHQKFKTVLPIRKVVKLYQSESQFKRMILNQYRKNNSGNKRVR